MSCTEREEIRITNTGSVRVSNPSPTIRITAGNVRRSLALGFRVGKWEPEAARVPNRVKQCLIDGITRIQRAYNVRLLCQSMSIKLTPPIFNLITLLVVLICSMSVSFCAVNCSFLGFHLLEIIKNIYFRDNLWSGRADSMRKITVAPNIYFFCRNIYFFIRIF